MGDSVQTFDNSLDARQTSELKGTRDLLYSKSCLSGSWAGYSQLLCSVQAMAHEWTQRTRKKRYSISTSNHVLFYLLYKHTNNDIFDDFPKIFNHFLKISEDSPRIFQKLHEGFQTFSANFQRFLKFWGRSEDILIIHQQIYAKSSISSLVRIWKIHHLSPGCVFVWILRVMYFPVKHSSLYNKCLVSHDFVHLLRSSRKYRSILP